MSVQENILKPLLQVFCTQVAPHSSNYLYLYLNRVFLTKVTGAALLLVLIFLLLRNTSYFKKHNVIVINVLFIPLSVPPNTLFCHIQNLILDKEFITFEGLTKYQVRHILL